MSYFLEQFYTFIEDGEVENGIATQIQSQALF